MKNRIFISLVCSLFVSNTYAQNVTLYNTVVDSSHGYQTHKYYFDINVQGITTRKAVVNSYLQTGNSFGSVVFTTGSEGKTFYGDQYGAEAVKTIDTLVKCGFEVFEVRWLGVMGWATGAQGYGPQGTLGCYSALVEHLKKNYFKNKTNVIAHGNSGGSMQIAYGLCLYGLDTVINMAILSGGPPSSNLRTGIFGNGTEPEYWGNSPSSLIFTDYLMGWLSNGNYCQNRVAPDSIKDIIDSASLVSPVAHRNYNYSNVMVNFVESDDPSRADHQAQIYYDTISSNKHWIFLSNVNVHDVPSNTIGADTIRNLILNFKNLPTNTNFEQVQQIENLFQLNINHLQALKKLNSISFYSLNGQLLRRNANVNQSEIINLDFLPKGLIIIQAENESGTTIIKHVKTNN